VTVHSRRQGVGGQLIAAAEDWFRLRGLRRIEVRVAVCNEVSKPFWRKMGFEPFVETVRKQID
jgi:GNAT superfamily N-acetyltransferase